MALKPVTLRMTGIWTTTMERISTMTIVMTISLGRMMNLRKTSQLVVLMIADIVDIALIKIGLGTRLNCEYLDLLPMTEPSVELRHRQNVIESQIPIVGVRTCYLFFGENNLLT